MDSTFIHNTETSLAWAPQVDVALVAVGVDPPLSKQDIDLIRKLSTYTAHLAVLLTKVDLLSPSEEQEVLVFVRSQLKQALGEEIPVYPYSTWAGYEHWRIHFQEAYMAPLSADTDRRKQEIISHKLAALVADCQSYLQLAQNAAEASQSKRLEFRTQTVVQKEFVADTRLSMQLTARQAMAGIRASISNELLPNERIIVQELLESFAQAKPDFPRNFGPMLAAFENWLQMALTTSLTDLSERKRADLAQPVAGLQQQYQRLLQAFRDQLSERTMALCGTPLRTTEPEIVVKPPTWPDVKIGRCFDHNWELLSPVLPIWLLRKSVWDRFHRKIGDETYKSLSRLTTQWEQILKEAISDLERVAQQRLAEIVSTIERLTSQPPEEPLGLRADLDALKAASRLLGNGSAKGNRTPI